MNRWHIALCIALNYALASATITTITIPAATGDGASLQLRLCGEVKNMRGRKVIEAGPYRYTIINRGKQGATFLAYDASAPLCLLKELADDPSNHESHALLERFVESLLGEDDVAMLEEICNQRSTDGADYGAAFLEHIDLIKHLDLLPVNVMAWLLNVRPELANEVGTQGFSLSDAVRLRQKALATKGAKRRKKIEPAVQDALRAYEHIAANIAKAQAVVAARTPLPAAPPQEPGAIRRAFEAITSLFGY